MNIKNNKNCKITINNEGIAVSEKEKTADEMFEELGYMTDENKYRTIYSNRDEDIIFDNEIKTILIENNTEITLAKLKAINKKVGELGWEK